MLKLFVAGLVLLALAIAATVFVLRRRARQRRVAQQLVISGTRGIDEGRFVTAGGIEQWIHIRGEDRANPVVLVLHGGPATSYVALTQIFQPWEKHFTVVQWDRRGVGKTFGRNRGPLEAMTLERIAADGAEVVAFLCSHLRKEKVLLLGHSMGSMIGLLIAARHPELLHAYLGTEQIVDMPRNEEVSYRIILERARRASNGDLVAKLERLGPPPYAKVRQWGVKQGAAEKVDAGYGGLASQIPSMIFSSPAYALRDLLHLVGGMRFCMAHLYSQWMAFEGRKLGLAFRIPMFVIQGEDDVMTPSALAREWIDELQAPQKAFVPIAGGGHLVFATAAEAYLAELLARVRPLCVDATSAVV